MHGLPRLGAGAGIDARKAMHRHLDVAAAARIEQRSACGAAGAPILRDPVVLRRRQTEVAIELRVRHGAQHVLVEQRDLGPFGGIMKPAEIDVIELAAEERRPLGLTHRCDLAGGVDRCNLRRARGRRARLRTHVELTVAFGSFPIQRC